MSRFKDGFFVGYIKKPVLLTPIALYGTVIFQLKLNVDI